MARRRVDKLRTISINEASHVAGFVLPGDVLITALSDCAVALNRFM